MNQGWIATIWQLLEEEGIQALTAEAIIAKHPHDAFEIYQHLGSAQDCLVYLWRYVDEQVLQRQDATLKGRDALFDVVMNYLEVLSPQKTVVRRLVSDLYCMPSLSFSLHSRTMLWGDDIFQMAQLEYKGLRSLLMRYGFLAFFVCCLEKWFDDDTADMSKTMAFVDSTLSQMETWAAYIPNVFGARVV